MPSLRTLLEYCKLFKISTTEDQEDQPKQDGIYDSECPKPPSWLEMEFTYLGNTVRHDEGTGKDIKNRLVKVINVVSMLNNV